MTRWYRCYGKRFIDLAVSIPAMILLSPLIAIVAIAVRMCLGPPVMFRDVRGGFGGRTMTLYKFRTMLDSRDASGELLCDEDRLTRLGAVLRSLSLDELPQLWNVIRGDMSLVGPRPLLARYLDRYTDEQARRHEVKPGITGWAQVHGRNAISWERKFELDVWYVDHSSFALDIRIAWLTLIHVLAKKGISADDHATMPEFIGPTTLDETDG